MAIVAKFEKRLREGGHWRMDLSRGELIDWAASGHVPLGWKLKRVGTVGWEIELSVAGEDSSQLFVIEALSQC